MSSVELIPVEKGGEYLEVHPTALAQHKTLGWRECERVEVAEEADDTPSTDAAPKRRGRPPNPKP